VLKLTTRQEEVAEEVYWYYADTYEDLWVPDNGDARWQRRVDPATGVYAYRRTTVSTNASTAWNVSAAALGVPAPPVAAMAVNAPTRLVIGNDDEAMEAYGWLRTLTIDVTSKLFHVKNTMPALNPGAENEWGSISHYSAQDLVAYQEAQVALTDEKRTRSIRLGVKFLQDGHSSVARWAQSTAGLGVQQAPLVALALRAHDLGLKLLTAFQ
jgi:hypothetical protein